MEKVLRVLLITAALLMILFFIFMFIFIFAVPESTTAVTTPVEGSQGLFHAWKTSLFTRLS